MDLAAVYLMTHLAPSVLMIMMKTDLEMLGWSCRVMTENASLEFSCRDSHKRWSYGRSSNWTLPSKTEGR